MPDGTVRADANKCDLRRTRSSILSGVEAIERRLLLWISVELMKNERWERKRQRGSSSPSERVPKFTFAWRSPAALMEYSSVQNKQYLQNAFT